MVNSVNVSLNPVTEGGEVSVEVTGITKNMQLQVLDLNGATVATISVPDNNGTQVVNVPMNVAKGYYIINAIQGATKSTHRVVVY